MAVLVGGKAFAMQFLQGLFTLIASAWLSLLVVNAPFFDEPRTVQTKKATHGAWPWRHPENGQTDSVVFTGRSDHRLCV